LSSDNPSYGEERQRLPDSIVSLQAHRIESVVNEVPIIRSESDPIAVGWKKSYFGGKIITRANTYNGQVIPFGRTEQGRDVSLATIGNSHGIEASFMSYGATLKDLILTMPNGRKLDVVLGFDTLSAYEEQRWRCGAIIGRTCSRIPNGSIVIEGSRYQLSRNDGNHHLHGGSEGFDKKAWDVVDLGRSHVTFCYRSPAFEEGYPGNLDMQVTYQITDENELVIHYKAISDAPTVCNPTSHTYFNLSGHQENSLEGHEMRLNANRYAIRNNEYLFTGEVSAVDGLAEDYRSWKEISLQQRIILESAGYLVDTGDRLKKIGDVRSTRTQCMMSVYSTHESVLFYAGTFIKPHPVGKGNVNYQSHGGFCLETMSPIGSSDRNGEGVLKAGLSFESETRFHFSFLERE
jgi:aldose 1-epimerase